MDFSDADIETIEVGEDRLVKHLDIHDLARFSHADVYATMIANIVPVAHITESEDECQLCYTKQGIFNLAP